jgi:pyridoxal phosphate enzyme (YggS family)
MPVAQKPSVSSAVALRLDEAQRRLAEACADADRKNPPVIVAVSKKQPDEKIYEALNAGHRIFGENRVQEARRKWPGIREQFPDVELHLIGPLQSNKAEEAVALFDVIETVDRPKIAAAIAAEIAKQGKSPRLLVQVNTGEEAQKAGVAPQNADKFLTECQEKHGLEIEGLMCIPPEDEPPAPHFALLAKIAARNGLSVLSMGMSGDYDIAAQLGATHVRIGTGIFGAREEAVTD